MKLIPQFSIRWALGLMAGCAGIFSIFALAIRGYEWAAGVSIGILSLVLVMTIYALLFGAVWLFSLITAPLRPAPSGRSPFRQQAAGVAPPSGQPGSPFGPQSPFLQTPAAEEAPGQGPPPPGQGPPPPSTLRCTPGETQTPQDVQAEQIVLEELADPDDPEQPRPGPEQP